MDQLIIEAPWRVKSVIAHALLGARRAERLGSIELLPHQVEAADRVRASLALYGGALLADHVGLGKTFVALAVAREHSRRLVVAPKAIESMWENAGSRVQISTEFVSFERLSRAPSSLGRFDLVIVDEAHHARNPATRRYASLALATIGARVLLVSATPLHNSPRDLHALLALFLGESAARFPADHLARCIVRRTASQIDSARLPSLGPVSWLALPDADAVLDAILAIPPPTPPRDGGVAAALLRLSLVRQWTSSDAALRATLRRRISRAGALTHALESGRHPTRRELASWIADDLGVQLAFPELVATGAVSDARALLDRIERHVTGVRQVLRILESHPRDADRARILRTIVERHCATRIVAFTQYADTASGMAGMLRDVRGVVLNTARGTRSAAGALPREEVLAQLAAEGRERGISHVRLLISTDLLSEGVNLHAASVLVHLDLPWTHARLEQRLGRLRRLGAAHDLVHVYAFALAARSERFAGIVRALERKARLAERSIGPAEEGTLLVGSWLDGSESVATTARIESLRVLLRQWLSTDEPRALEPDAQAPLAAAMVSRHRDTGSFLALVHDDGVWRLVAGRGDAVSLDPSAILDAASAADGTSAPHLTSDLTRDASAVERWIAGRHAERSLAVSWSPDDLSAAHTAALRTIDRVVASAPRARRRHLMLSASRARTAVVNVRGAGAERVLRDLVTRLSVDPQRALEQTIDALDALAAPVPSPPTDSATRLVALLSILPARR
jgi:superfamily II DNA or RNA helicase